MGWGKCSQRTGRMTTRERLFLTPWEKFTKYHIIPWKLILNVLLLVVVTGQVLAMNLHEADYVQATKRNWFYFFFPDGYDFDDPFDFAATVGDGVDALQRAVDGYFTMNEVSVDTYLYEIGPDGSPLQPTLTVTSYSNIASLFNPNVSFSPDTAQAVYTLNSTWLGPLDPSLGEGAQRAFFHSLVSMRLDFPPIRNFAFGPLYRNCYTWDVAVVYDFSNRGQLLILLDADIQRTCDVYASPFAALRDKLLWVNVVVIGLSALHAWLLLRAIAKSLRLLFRLRSWAKAQAAAVTAMDGGGPEAEEDLSLLHKRDLSAVGGGGGGAQPRRVRGSSPGAVDGTSAGGSGYEEPLLASAAARGGLRRRSSVGEAASLLPPLQQSRHLVPGVSASPLLAPGESAHDFHIDGSGDVVKTSALLHPGLSAPAAAVPADDAAELPAAVDTSWASVDWREWAKLVNGWAVIALVADALNIASAALNLRAGTAGVPTEIGPALVMGLGVALLWLGVIRYVEHDRAYFNMILTLRRATPRVLRFLVGVLPVFLAYAFFAVLLWGDRVERFANPRTAFITLFANLNGDVVRETFMDLLNVHPVTAQLFFYSFIALHIYVVLNIIIAVVEESYFITVAKTADIAMRAETQEDDARSMEAAARAAMDAAGEEEEDGGGPGLERARSSAALRMSQAPLRGLLSPGGENATAAPAAAAAAAALTAVAAKADSHSLKQPDAGSASDRFATLLRLAEWDEVLTGERVGGGGGSRAHGALSSGTPHGGTPVAGASPSQQQQNRAGGSPQQLQQQRPGLARGKSAVSMLLAGSSGQRPGTLGSPAGSASASGTPHPRGGE